MKVLVVNAGSSSLKCTLFAMPERRAEAVGRVERIGEAAPALHFEARGKAQFEPCNARSHREALDLLMHRLVSSGALGDTGEVAAVGHRVVHGGSLSHSILVDARALELIRQNSALAPLHNPPNLAALEAALELLPGRPHVAVFDTAFHSTMPPHAFIYAIPYFLYEQHRVRAYGFHGTSFRYVTARAAQMLGKPPERVNLIALHLGNGCSAAAVKNGQSVDTSMGMTPLQGLVMGTRCGDIDPGLPCLLGELLAMGPSEVYHKLLNRQGGLLGISGLSNDMRDILRAAAEGHQRAQLALDVFCYRVKKYIGAYMAVLGGADALVFTAGIGENSPPVRARCCQGLEGLGIALDEARNAAAVGREAVISADASPVKVLVIPTDEALQIAIETCQVIGKDKNNEDRAV